MLMLSYQYSDPDGDPEGAPEILWYRDGTHVAQYDGTLAVPGSAMSTGQVWSAIARPGDGTETSISQASAPLVILGYDIGFYIILFVLIGAGALVVAFVLYKQGGSKSKIQ